MTNRKKVFLALGITPIILSFLVIVIINIFFDVSKLLSNPKEFVTTQFPTLYMDFKEIALNSGSENIPAGVALNVPLIKLKLSRNDNAHFSDLMEKFNSPDYGVKYYYEHNEWRKAKLEFEGKKYDIKVKSHGREPTGHQEGRFISLSVKMPKGQLIFGANRFSLIVRSRIYTSRLQSIALAEHLKILYQPEKLVRVKLTGQDEKYFFFEKKFNNKFMEAEGKSSFRRLEYSVTQLQSADKSLVNITDQNSYTEQELISYLVLALKEEGVPESHFEPIISKYLAINKVISLRSTEIEDYFNPEYIAKFDALRTVMGFIGHGWMRSNFYNFYNQADGLFYPGITRDNKPSKHNLIDHETIESKFNSWGAGEIAGKFTFPLFDALSKSDSHRQLKYKEISKVLNDYPTIIKAKQEALINKFNTIHSYGLASPILRKLDQFSNNLIPHNLSVLKKYLSDASPTINVSGNNNKITFVIEPRSMSAIGIDHLKIKSLIKNTKSNVRLSLSVASGDNLVEYPSNSALLKVSENGIIDLSSLVQNLEMFTGLDDELNRMSRKYILSIEADGIDFSSTSLDEINLILKNRIMQSVIDKSDINLTLGNIVELADYGPPTPYQASSFVGQSAFDSLQKQFPEITMTRANDDRLIIHSGQYKITKDFIIPRGLKLEISSGTTLLLGENIALMGYQGVDVKGTKSAPVTISALDSEKPYGTVGFLGNQSTVSTINYLNQSHGNERWVNGVFFSGGFSIHYNGQVILRNSSIKNNHADDGANFKNSGNVLIEDTIFQDNFADQIDLDYTNAHVNKTQFLNTKGGDLNGDGLDISGSKVIVTNSSFTNFSDKGISVGENSNILVFKSKLQNNNNGAAVKDRSNAYLINVDFINNKTDIASYMKKRIFGGANTFLGSDYKSKSPLKFNFDKKSKLHYFTKEIDINDLGLSNETLNFDLIFSMLNNAEYKKVTVEDTYEAENE